MTPAGAIQAAWRSLPLGSLDDIIGRGSCLILAPHADDESLGCGGLIAACCAAGRKPLVAFLTDGTGSHPHSRAYPPERLREVRMREAQQALACLGLSPDRAVFLEQRDTAAPHSGPAFDAVVGKLLALVGGASARLAPWRHDPHCDHEAASLVAASVASVAGIRHVAYPVWGWTLPPDEPVAASQPQGWRFDVTPYLPMKRRAIQAHQSQYSGLITDDPTGFRLPPALLSVFDVPCETFIKP